MKQSTINLLRAAAARKRKKDLRRSLAWYVAGTAIARLRNDGRTLDIAFAIAPGDNAATIAKHIRTHYPKATVLAMAYAPHRSAKQHSLSAGGGSKNDCSRGVDIRGLASPATSTISVHITNGDKR